MSLWVNRTLCDILHDMRKCHETHNYGNLLGLIEETQSAANRMEAAIGDIKDIQQVEKRWRECKEKDRALDLLERHKKEREKLKEELSSGKTE